MKASMILEWLKTNYEWLLSFIALIISIFTLQEIKKERTLSYKPKIIPDQPCYFLQAPKDFQGAIWKTEFDDIYLKKEEPSINEAEMAFINIGLGPAIDVKFTWQYDAKKVINQLVDLSKLMPDYVNFDSEKNAITLIREVKSPKFFRNSKKYSMDVSADFLNSRYFILPASQNTSGKTFIKLPQLYVLYLSVISLCITYYDGKDTYQAQVPLTIEIDSQDSGGKRKKDRYTFDFSLVNTTGFVSHDEQKFSISQNFGMCNISIRMIKLPKLR